MGLFRKKKKSTMFLAEQPQSLNTLHQNLTFTATEQYKLIRANLDFTLPPDEKCPIIGITSSMRGEGKSTTAVNLSYVCAEKGKRVLLIDGDLRIPSVAKKMGIESNPGLVELLMGDTTPLSHYQSSMLPNWYIIPAGTIPPNPSELLGSERMEKLLKRLREMFDYIIIDLPPVNIVSDAIAVSNLLSGMIVVVREEYTEKRELERCMRQLQLSEANILGCVMNAAKSGSGAYGKYKKYRYYSYSHYALSDTKGKKQ